MSGAIVCIGGGGFLMDDARLLQERYLVSLLARQERPRVVYLGTAAGDGERAQLRFVQAFLKLGCEPRTLPFFPYNMGLDYAAEIAAADLVYVGGGNTVAMLAVWREFEFDTALRRAWDAGTVFAGISAGANCWFERYVTDSIPGGGEREGLGWLSGTFCPHLDSEAWRQPLLAKANRMPAFGAPDSVLLRFDDARLTEAVCDKPGLAAVQRGADGTLEALPTRLLSGS